MLIGSAVELPGCHTQAKTYDELCSGMKEAIELCLEVEKDSGKEGARRVKIFPEHCRIF